MRRGIVMSQEIYRYVLLKTLGKLKLIIISFGLFKAICALIGFAVPITNVSAFSLAHYGMLEIGFADGVGTNVLLSGKYDR